MHCLRCSYALPMLLLAAATGSSAGEPNCDTFITSAPYTISAQGHYCLANDLAYPSATGVAITINANSVVLDLKGYKVGGQAAGLASFAVGIQALEHDTVVVRNGLVRGFNTGIYLRGSNNLVEAVRADANTRFGIFLGNGSNNTVRDCIVGNTGGTTTTTAYSVALWVAGPYGFAMNNTVTGTRPSSGGTDTFGLVVDPNGRAVDNQVIGNGDTASATNYCFSFGTGTIYKGNVASACGVMYLGTGTPVGTTNYP